MFQLPRMLQSPRTQQIHACLGEIARDASGYLIPRTIEQTGLLLQQHLGERGIQISLREACQRVDTYQRARGR
jgi:hypothetical protein